MEKSEFISLDVFCRQHDTTLSFMDLLQNFGFIKIIHVDDADCIMIDQLGELEKIMRLHNELEINLEGIDAITHLLQRIREMQTEIQVLKNRLALYED
ncbi:MAG: chaperone modulator CbpM [Sediminibacterium sp.]